MKIGVPTETFPGEVRVALVPKETKELAQRGETLQVQSGAGDRAGFSDHLYEEAGATIVKDRDEVFEGSDTILQVRGPGANRHSGEDDRRLLREGQNLIAFFDPLGHPESMHALAATGVTAFAMELMPRITRAQSMDALSSMASIAGYKAALLGASHLPKIFPMMMTAAGSIAPARVFVVGAGVAGLQAIATARRLGAVVEAYDIRPEVREQVESVGGRFVEVDVPQETSSAQGGYAAAQSEAFYEKQRELMAKHVHSADVVIATAAVPGRRAPRLVSTTMLQGMKAGSVVVDLAAEQGGNCEATKPGETVVEHGVAVIGAVNVPASVPHHASQMYARNVSTFLRHLLDDEGGLAMDLDDEITRETLICHQGQITHQRVQEAVAAHAAA